MTVYFRGAGEKGDEVVPVEPDEDQAEGEVNAGELYQEGQTVHGNVAVKIDDTVYHFDKPESELESGEPRQLPDSWRVEFEFDEDLVAHTGGMEPGFNPKRARFWMGVLDSDSARTLDADPYILVVKLYKGDELQETVKVYFAVKDAPLPAKQEEVKGKPTPP